MRQPDLHSAATQVANSGCELQLESITIMGKPSRDVTPRRIIDCVELLSNSLPSLRLIHLQTFFDPPKKITAWARGLGEGNEGEFVQIPAERGNAARELCDWRWMSE